MSQETISKDPKKLQKAVDKITEAIELDKRKIINMRKLRWELTRQLHISSKKFWLDGVTNATLMTLHVDYADEYELVFDKEYDNRNDKYSLEGAKCWAIWQKKRWETAKGIVC